MWLNFEWNHLCLCQNEVECLHLIHLALISETKATWKQNVVSCFPIKKIIFTLWHQKNKYWKWENDIHTRAERKRGEEGENDLMRPTKTKTEPSQKSFLLDVHNWTLLITHTHFVEIHRLPWFSDLNKSPHAVSFNRAATCTSSNLTNACTVLSVDESTLCVLSANTRDMQFNSS